MRVLVLGTSHAATLRRAFPQIAQEFPGLKLEFWGLPGAAFMKAAVGADGLLRPDSADGIGLRKTTDWNIAESIDLARYDRIFLVGLRYGIKAAFAMMRDLQPVEWGSRKGAAPVSLSFLRATIMAEARAALAAQTLRTPFDGRFRLMPAPFPAASVLSEASPQYEPLTRTVTHLPKADTLAAMFKTALETVHSEFGLGFVAQPAQTLSAPLLTQETYLEAPETDARHMNAEYGLIAFRALMAAETAQAAQGAVPAQD